MHKTLSRFQPNWPSNKLHCTLSILATASEQETLWTTPIALHPSDSSHINTLVSTHTLTCGAENGTLTSGADPQAWWAILCPQLIFSVICFSSLHRIPQHKYLCPQIFASLPVLENQDKQRQQHTQQVIIRTASSQNPML